MNRLIHSFVLQPYEKDRTENIQKTYKKCAPYGNCTEIVQKIYKKNAKFCNSSLVETGSLFELLQILAHFLYIFCTISVQFPYGAHFLYVFCMFSYVFCMFSVRSFFIGLHIVSYIPSPFLPYSSCFVFLLGIPLVPPLFCSYHIPL